MLIYAKIEISDVCSIRSSIVLNHGYITFKQLLFIFSSNSSQNSQNLVIFSAPEGQLSGNLRSDPYPTKMITAQKVFDLEKKMKHFWSRGTLYHFMVVTSKKVGVESMAGIWPFLQVFTKTAS